MMHALVIPLLEGLKTILALFLYLLDKFKNNLATAGL